MSDVNSPAEWYYVGHYGQLGPLTMAQMNELAGDGVIEADTFVWRQGMTDWSPAGSVPELGEALGVVQHEPPPNPPGFRPTPPQAPTQTMVSPTPSQQPVMSQHPAVPQQPENYSMVQQNSWQYIQTHAPISDKKKVLAGVLNILIPGVGRLYMGYAAHGVLQLLLTPCGIGIVWGWIDGIYILSGGVKLDGYGRRLVD